MVNAEDRITQYQALIDTHPEIELKGKNMLYTSINGHMFSIMNKGQGLGLRLSKEEREKFLDDCNTQPHESHGAVMREYVRVPDELLADTQALAPYLVKSYEYVKTLEPK